MTVVWRVPGRLEVLGKHTDYAGGDVLVCAVERGVVASASRGAGDAIVARSSGFADPVTVRAGLDPGLPAGHWGRYLQTVLDRLTANFGPVAGAELAFSSDLPMASGMSSSSALLVASALALADLNGLRRSDGWRHVLGDDPLRLASYLASVENGRSFGGLAGHAGVGTLGGSEDHTAMLCGERDALGHFGFAPVALRGRVPWPPGWTFVVAVSGVTAEKSGATRDLYNRASLATTEALSRWNQRTGRADPTLADAVRSDPGAPALLQGLVRGDPYLGSRVTQFVEESEVLVPAATQALLSGDLSGFGGAVDESQRLAESHLGNQVPQTIALASAARDLGARAASAFGAGFGGSVWAMVPDADADGFAAAWLARFRRGFPAQAAAASAFATSPADPAGRVDAAGWGV